MLRRPALWTNSMVNSRRAKARKRLFVSRSFPYSTPTAFSASRSIGLRFSFTPVPRALFPDDQGLIEGRQACGESRQYFVVAICRGLAVVNSLVETCGRNFST